MKYLVERRQEEKERRRAEIIDAAEARRRVGSPRSRWTKSRGPRGCRAPCFTSISRTSATCSWRWSIARSTSCACVPQAPPGHPDGLREVEAFGRAYLAFSHDNPLYFDAFAASAGALGLHSRRTRTRRVHGRGPPRARGADAGFDRGVHDGSIRNDVGAPSVIRFRFGRSSTV